MFLPVWWFAGPDNGRIVRLGSPNANLSLDVPWAEKESSRRENGSFAPPMRGRQTLT